MTRAQSTKLSEQAQPKLDPAAALQLAWYCWTALLVVPFGLFYWLLWHQALTESPELPPQIWNWFVTAMVFMGLIVIGATFWRSFIFKDYWAGKTISPARYLVGTISVWVALAVSGIFSLLGCLAYKTIMPNLIPALMALLVYLLLFPSGRAMTNPVGDAEDPEVYEEPR